MTDLLLHAVSISLALLLKMLNIGEPNPIFLFEKAPKAAEVKRM